MNITIEINSGCWPIFIDFVVVVVVFIFIVIFHFWAIQIVRYHHLRRCRVRVRYIALNLFLSIGNNLNHIFFIPPWVLFVYPLLPTCTYYLYQQSTNRSTFVKIYILPIFVIIFYKYENLQSSLLERYWMISFLSVLSGLNRQKNV